MALSGGIGNAQTDDRDVTTTWNQQSAGGAVQGLGGQSLTLGAGASLQLDQTSPLAQSALQEIAQQALTESQTAFRAGASLASEGLEAAKLGLSPGVSTTKYLVLGAVALGAFFLFRKR